MKDLLPGTLHIGDVKVEFPVILSPMAGYTETAFRSLCMDFKCGMTYTEVINAQAVVFGSKQTMHMLETDEREHPVAGHIYGADLDMMAKASAMIEELGRFQTIDVNCGCPVRKIVSKGSGAALMKDPGKIYRIVACIKDVVSLPVTVKTRIGPSPDNRNIFDILKAAEDAGAAAIAIHARFTSKRHSGPPDWETLAEVKSRSSIPVIGNGGVMTADDAFRMYAETNVDGIMVGRGAVGNPWIFREIYARANGQDYSAPTLEERKAVIVEHLDRLIAYKSKAPKLQDKSDEIWESRAAIHFRGQLFRYLAGFRGWNRIKKQLNDMNSREAVLAAVDEVMGLWELM